jgi:glycopeptide antibiotics resistance protein
MSVLFYICAIAVNVLWLSIGNGFSVLQQISIPILTVGLIGIGTVCSLAGRNRAARKRGLCLFLWAVLLYYLAILSVLLFFGGLFHLERGWGGAVNLEPFHTIRRFYIHYQHTGSLSSFFNLLGNIILLIPFGVIMPLMFRMMRRFWIFFPAAALFSLGIEYLQWITSTGIADIDDSILNFVGAAGGYIVTRICQIVWFSLQNKGKKKKKYNQ